MTRPPFRPVLGAAAGLMIGVGGVLAADDPAPAAPVPSGKPKPAWVERLASESKKLAFWDKDKKPADPPSAPPATPPAAATKKSKPTGRPAVTPEASSKPEAASASRRRPPTAQKPPSGPQTPPGEPPAEKKSLLSKLPALPFTKKREEVDAGTPPPAPVASESKKKPPVQSKPAQNQPAAPAKRGESAPPAAADPVEGEPVGEKRSGLFDLGRFLPGGKKPEIEPAPDAPNANALADRKSKGRATPTVPEAGPSKPAPGKPGVKPPAVAEADPASTGKVSFWDRMTAAITPKSNPEAKPATLPVPKGLPPALAGEVDAATFVITKDDSPFYTFGPQQATPPDAYLPTGTVVTLTQKNWGWATVRLGDGRSGIVDRSALRPAVLADLVPAGQRPGDPLMASLTPGQTGRKSSPNFVLPAAEMPDLPTSGDAAAVAGNPLLLPFSPDDVTDPGQLPPLPEIPPLPEPGPDSPANDPPSATPETPEPAAPAAPAPEPADPEPVAPEPGAPAPEKAPDTGEGASSPPAAPSEEAPATEPAPKTEGGQ